MKCKHLLLTIIGILLTGFLYIVYATITDPNLPEYTINFYIEAVADNVSIPSSQKIGDSCDGELNNHKILSRVQIGIFDQKKQLLTNPVIPYGHYTDIVKRERYYDTNHTKVTCEIKFEAQVPNRDFYEILIPDIYQQTLSREELHNRGWAIKLLIH